MHVSSQSQASQVWGLYCLSRMCMPSTCGPNEPCSQSQSCFVLSTHSSCSFYVNTICCANSYWQVRQQSLVQWQAVMAHQVFGSTWWTEICPCRSNIRLSCWASLAVLLPNSCVKKCKKLHVPIEFRILYLSNAAAKAVWRYGKSINR